MSAELKSLPICDEHETHHDLIDKINLQIDVTIRQKIFLNSRYIVTFAIGLRCSPVVTTLANEKGTSV